MSDENKQESLTPEERKRRDEEYCRIARTITPEDSEKVRALLDAGLGQARFTPPYRIDIRSCAHAREDRPGCGWTLPLLDIAIQRARAITEGSCRDAKDFLDWKCFGEYAVIHDAVGWLILDTSNEVKDVEGKAVHAVEGLSGR